MSRPARLPIATLSTVVLTLAALEVSMFVAVVPVAHASTTPGYNGRIVFDSFRDGTDRVYSMNPDGSEVRPVSGDPPAFSAQYAPAGTKVAYVATLGLQNGVFNHALAFREDVPAAAAPAYRFPELPGTSGVQCVDAVQPTWSGDGAAVAFTCLTRGRDLSSTTYSEHNIWVTTDANFAVAKRLTSTDTFEEWPSWLPDGRNLVFQSSVAGDHDFKIETVTADGTLRTPLASVPNPGGVFNPEYSPDGTKILYEVRATADWASNELWLMNADGSGKTRLTHDAVWEGFPAWSPDGRKILFSYHSTTCGCDTLATMNPSATDVPHVIGGAWNSGNWNNYAPHWQQLPDNDPPTVPTVTGLHAFTTASSVTLHLASTDAGAGVEKYFVTSRAVAWNDPTWGAWSSATTVRTTTFTRSSLRPGWTYCFRVTAEDRAGNFSAARTVCTARMLDDPAATRSAGWTPLSSSSYYGGSALRTTTKGANLTLRGFTGRRVALLVRTCSTCGGVHLSVGGISFTSRSTYSTTSRYRVLLTFPALGLTTATIRVTTTSSKPVYIDGVGLSRA